MLVCCTVNHAPEKKVHVHTNISYRNIFRAIAVNRPKQMSNTGKFIEPFPGFCVCFTDPVEVGEELASNFLILGTSFETSEN